MTMRLILLAILAAFTAHCDKKTAPKGATPTATPYYPQPTYGGSAGITSEIITITCSSGCSASDSMLVALNQSYTWSFTATSSSGGVANIQSITASPMPSATSMQISGSSVTFRPTTQSELIGTLIVQATGSTGTAQSKSFTWTSGNGLTGTSTGSGLSSIMIAMLPTLIGTLTGNRQMAMMGPMLLGMQTGGMIGTGMMPYGVNTMNPYGTTGMYPYGATGMYPYSTMGQYPNNSGYGYPTPTPYRGY